MEDKHGYLYIVGRLKELIKFKGLQVAPASLEDVLLTHAAVADCGVIGIPDERAGELPKAFVVKKAGHKVTSKELIAFVAGKVLISSFNNLSTYRLTLSQTKQVQVLKTLWEKEKLFITSNFSFSNSVF